MVKGLCRAVVLVLCAAVGPTGCATDQAHQQTTQGQFQLLGEPDFGWSLSGDPRVAPLQVFSDHRRIWLQWHHDQPVPAILVLEQGHWQLAQTHHHGKFSVIEGQWSQVRFQGAGLRADAIRTGLQKPAHLRDQGATESRGHGERASTQTESLKEAARVFEVDPADRTIRQTLVRWATQNGWRFDNTHWAVPMDLPVTAYARFDGDFVSAVRGLLSAVQMTGRALAPCFYTNRVLRVISANEVCDSSAKTAQAQP